MCQFHSWSGLCSTWSPWCQSQLGSPPWINLRNITQVLWITPSNKTFLVATYPCKFADFIFPCYPREAVCHQCFGGEKLRKKKILFCMAGWNISTVPVVWNHCEMLEVVCLVRMPTIKQRTTHFNRLQLWKAALEMLDKARYGPKPIGSSVNAASMYF